MHLFDLGCIVMASGTLGLWIGIRFASKHQRNLEAAYTGLSLRVRQFLSAHPVAPGILPTTQEDLLALKRALIQAEECLDVTTAFRVASPASAEALPGNGALLDAG